MSAPPKRSGFEEVVEAEGHLIDSHIMERIFDTVVESDGKFEVERFHIGRTNADPSRLRLRIETSTQEELDRLLGQLLALGCIPADGAHAELKIVEADRCAPPDFYSTTNHRTYVRVKKEWLEVEKQRMDAVIVVENGHAQCRRLRDLREGDQVVVGMKGIRVVPESKDTRLPS
jgi:hypothetical protein